MNCVREYRISYRYRNIWQRYEILSISCSPTSNCFTSFAVPYCNGYTITLLNNYFTLTILLPKYSSGNKVLLGYDNAHFVH